MKIMKIWLIIAIAAIICFSFAACDNPWIGINPGDIAPDDITPGNIILEHECSWNEALSSNTEHHWNECTDPGCDEKSELVGHSEHNCECGFITHTFSEEWHKDGTHHWKGCTDAYCEEKDSSEVHSGNPCGTCNYTFHIHSFSEDWSNGAEHHWKECTAGDCEEKSETADHSIAHGLCTVCGYGTLTHTYSEDWSSNATQHWKECTVGDCEEKSETADHSIAHGFCTVCEYGTLTHTFSTTWSSNATQHWKGCTVGDCEEKSETADHSIAHGLCTVCGYGAITHTFSTTWSSNTVQHWKECTFTGCDVKTGTANHSPANDICETCEYDNTFVISEGAAVSAPTKENIDITKTSITITAVTPPGNGQTVEYVISTTNTAPETGWQDSPSFSGLTEGTTYYIFARSKANDTHNAGTLSAGLEVTTGSDPITTNKAYGKFPVAQVRDCSRSPAFPANGKSMSLSNFGAPYSDITGSRISNTDLNTSGAYFQLKEASNYSESNKNLVLELYNADGTRLREVSRNGKIYLFYDEGFLYISTSGDYGYVFFYDPLNGRTSITVTSFTMP